MTAEENIGFGLRMKGVGREEAAKRTQKLLKLIQLEDLRSRYPSQMSGGQQQRVAVARALVNNPKMLLLDEPLGALDYQLRKTLQIELKDLQEELGLTFVFVTHDQEEALTMSDRIVIMDKGKSSRTMIPIRFTIIQNKICRRIHRGKQFFDNGKEILVLRPES